jgi:hypothetical protein
MNGFVSYKKNLEGLLPKIVDNTHLHAKWLNTLSFLENCGARKIAACEHPTLVKEEMLKHASEEFRHAHYLKKQIQRISSPITDYSLSHLLGGTKSLQYLTYLDVQTSRFLKKEKHSKSKIKELAYLLVTYAIELRAQELYPIYEGVLRKHGSKVIVKSILLEEEEHLQEMKEGLAKLLNGKSYAKEICAIESNLCKQWIASITKEVKKFFKIFSP